MKSNGFKPLNLAIVKSFIYQVCSGLAAIHERGIQHLDLKPENILIDRDCSLFKLADFGTAEWTCASKIGLVGTREYRAPEIILGLNHTQACDIWAIGCIIFELLTGHTLFDPRNYSLHNIVRDEDHLVQMQELMGPFPTWMMRGSRRRRFLTRNGQPKNIDHIYAKPLNQLLRDFNICDSDLLDLLNRMLVLDPMHRATAKECMAFGYIAKN
jgi:serine/threonine protein kinase